MKCGLFGVVGMFGASNLSGMIVQLQEEDLPLVIDFRMRMMTEAGAIARMADDWRELTHAHYAEGYRRGSCAHFGWRENGSVVASAGAIIKDDFPAFTTKARCYGWIMDVYVLPEYRRQGIAQRLTQRTLEWLREKGVVFARLTASDEARRLGIYERLGFQMSNEMRLRLDAPVENQLTAQEYGAPKPCH